jgi:DNA processing protein
VDGAETILEVARGDRLWPAELDEVPVPPAQVWVRGRSELLLHRPRAAVVGTRAPTPYGEAQAARFSSRLSAAGVCVVSGLARGVDDAAHRAALEAGGATVAVLGCGVDRPWPAGETARAVAAEGCLVSELPAGSPPRRHHFPLRNRLIAALAEVVVVVEAAARSGSLITARWAADLGKTVLAVPGRVDHPMSRGCHRLIREGALIAETPEEVLEEMQLSAPPAPAGPRDPDDPRDPEDALANALRGETSTVDELAERLSRPVADVLVELVRREIAGEVVRSPGGLWRLS